MFIDTWTLVWLFCVWFYGFRRFGSRICRCNDRCLCNSHFIFAFCTFRYCLILTDICTLESYFSVWFCDFCSSGLHMSLRRNILLCNYQLILGDLFFRFTFYAYWPLNGSTALLSVVLWFAKPWFPYASVQWSWLMLVSFHFGCFYIPNLVFAYWHLNSRNVLVLFIFCLL